MASYYLYIAFLLASGNKLALGQVLLSHLYRGSFKWNPILLLFGVLFGFCNYGFLPIFRTFVLLPLHFHPLCSFAFARTDYCQFRTKEMFERLYTLYSHPSPPYPPILLPGFLQIPMSFSSCQFVSPIATNSFFFPDQKGFFSVSLRSSS